MVVSALTFGSAVMRFGGRTDVGINVGINVGVNPGRVCCGVC